jgi:hypothetical protein
VFRNIGKQVVRQLSAWVSRNELFERYGERAIEPARPMRTMRTRIRSPCCDLLRKSRRGFSRDRWC